MKQILPVLFLFLVILPSLAFAAIDFKISNFEKVNDYYSVDAIITGAATGSSYFIQSMFKRTDVTGYFGYTWGQKGDWIKYLSSPDENYIKTDFPILPSAQTLKFLIKPDTDNSKYIGAGEYLLKLKRYTGNSQDGEFSNNTLTVTLTDTAPTPEPTPTPTSSPTEAPIPTSTPTSTSTPTPVKTPAPTAIKTPTPTPKSSPTPLPTSNIRDLSSSPSSVLGTSTSSAKVLPSSDPSPTPLPTSNIRDLSSNTPVLKYTFVFGAILTAISGGWLYFRHHND